MAKGNEKVKTDIKAWLLSFERLANRSVVVSLLIQNGQVEFISCVHKDLYLGEHQTEEDEKPEDILLKSKSNKEKVIQSNMMLYYFG